MNEKHYLDKPLGDFVDALDKMIAACKAMEQGCKELSESCKAASVTFKEEADKCQ